MLVSLLTLLVDMFLWRLILLVYWLMWLQNGVFGANFAQAERAEYRKGCMARVLQYEGLKTEAAMDVVLRVEDR